MPSESHEPAWLPHFPNRNCCHPFRRCLRLVPPKRQTGPDCQPGTPLDFASCSRMKRFRLSTWDTLPDYCVLSTELTTRRRTTKCGGNSPSCVSHTLRSLESRGSGDVTPRTDFFYVLPPGKHTFRMM